MSYNVVNLYILILIKLLVALIFIPKLTNFKLSCFVSLIDYQLYFTKYKDFSSSTALLSTTI